MQERATERGTMAWACVEFLSARMGLPNEAGSDAALRYRDMSGLSILEMARVILREAGGPALRDDRELILRALTTSDFPKLMSDIVNKTLSATYKFAPGSFATWTARTAAKNFLPFGVDRIAPPSDLPEVDEDNEFKSLDVKEGEEVARVRTFGGILGLSRQAIINDRLGVLKDIGRALGMTAKMSQNRRVYKQLLANPVLSDGIPVFHADRGNLLTGAGSALSRDSLALGVKTMRMMTDDAGNPLSVEPKFLLVPPSLEITAFELCFSDSIPGQTNAAVPNIFKKLGIVPVVEPLLESPNLSGSSSTAWYLLPDPELWPVFTTVTLGGEDNLEPYTESQAAWVRDEIQHKVRTDFDCCPVGCKAVKSAGQ